MWREMAIVVFDRLAWSSSMERTGRAADIANVSSTTDGRRSLYRPAKGSFGRDTDRMCSDDGYLT